jgi:hypothetical protein
MAVTMVATATMAPRVQDTIHLTSLASNVAILRG